MNKIMSIYGIRTRRLGNTAYYSGPPDYRVGNYAMVDTEQGKTVAKILAGPLKMLPGCAEDDLPAIIRLATTEDLEILHSNSLLCKQARVFCKKRIEERRLDMKLVDVEVFFDRSKLLFYFTAPTRIDFRELVKDLVREFRARIELRQIGVRHEIQVVGAIGNCGNVCCCRGHLRKFAPVTIKMAKEQNLFLNPGKISGICGRLLCCLSYEQENYEQFHRESPKAGKKYQTSKGLAKVLRTNMFKNSVSALMENNEEVQLSLEEWQNLDPVRASLDNARPDEDDDMEEGEIGDIFDQSQSQEENFLGIFPN